MNDILIFLRNLFPDTCHDRLYLVGGMVRDYLQGRGIRDIDLVAAMTADEFTELGFRLVEGRSTTPIWLGYDAAFGTIEITPLSHSKDLKKDLANRDFTVNAMAMNLSGEIIDPLDGRSDLKRRRLRTCGPCSFIYDPLRIFRGLRFEADGWRMTPATEELIREQEWSPFLPEIPVERFSRELLKAMETPEPERFFQRMLEFKVGDNYLPEIFRMPSIPAGPMIHHPEGDLFTHSCQVLQRLTQHSNNPLARFCAFFHDIGKLATDPSHYPGHHGHDEAGFELARTFCDRLRLPAAYRTALAWTSRLHGKMNRWAELRDSTRLRTAEQAVKAGVGDIIALVSAADKGCGAPPATWIRAVKAARMSTTELGIDPVRLDGMRPEHRADFIRQKRVEIFAISS